MVIIKAELKNPQKLQNVIKFSQSLPGHDHQHREFGAKDTIQLYQQNFAQLYKCAQLEVMPNFYVVRSTSCTSRISVNI